MQLKHSTPSKVLHADEAGPSTALSVPATPSTPNTDTTTVTSPSRDDLYTDAFNFALSKIFPSILMKRLTSKDSINQRTRVIPHSDVVLAVSRTEASLTVKIAEKKPESKRSKKSLDGLYEVLAPGSSVIKTDAYTSIIKEPGKRKVTIRNSDLAKF